MNHVEEILHEKSETIYLRLMEISDTEKIVEWRNNPRVRYNFIYQKPFTVEGHLNWIHTQIAPGHVVQFVICEKKSGKAVGSSYLRDIDRENGHAEYGMFIGEDDAAGKGYGTQAAIVTLAYAFEELGLKSVNMRVFEDNIPSRKSCVKAGFKLQEGKYEEVDINGAKRKVLFMEASK